MRSRDRSRQPRACIAIGTAVVGLLLISTSLAGPSESEPARTGALGAPSVHVTPSPQPTPVRGQSGSRTERRVIPDEISGPVLTESAPVSVSIPRIGAKSALVRLGLEAGGQLEVPADPARAGWFTGGAAPGALGPAVIAGHVTWNGAPAVFYRLGRLRPGDRVIVDRSDGRTAVFTVDRMTRVPKSRFPTEAVYGAIDHAGLRVITCGGTYDASRHRYLDNVVVFASLSAVHRSSDR
jgi:hypothetical protein